MKTIRLINMYILYIYTMYNENQEQIVRIAKTFGNGAHISVPKGWTGEQVVLVRSQKKSLRERIFSVLDSYLNSVVGVYLYGSYARDEQGEDSDIDLFVITDKKIEIKAEGFEILCLGQKEIEKAIQLEPLLMYAILSEAKHLINSSLLENLKKNYKPTVDYFREYLKDCQRMIKISEEFLESEKAEFIISEAVIYSLVLRLRGIFIIKSIVKVDKYSHKLFKSWIRAKVSQIDFGLIYESYRGSKNEKRVKQKIKVRDIKILLEFFKKEIVVL